MYTPHFTLKLLSFTTGWTGRHIYSQILEWDLFVSSLTFCVCSFSENRFYFLEDPLHLINSLITFFWFSIVFRVAFQGVEESMSSRWIDWKCALFNDGCSMASICVWRLVITTLWKPWNLFFWCKPVWTDFEESDCKRPSGVWKKGGRIEGRKDSIKEKKERERKRKRELLCWEWQESAWQEFPAIKRSSQRLGSFQIIPLFY